MVIITSIEVILFMALLEFLKKEKDIRKIFGERELKIIEKQLWGIKLTQSEKNRLSRDVRKKLEVIEALSDFKEEFKLKKGAKIKELVDEIKEEILQSKYSSKILKIYLFGSAVSNELTFRSDIDIAVEFDSINQKEATEFRISFSANEKVDVQVYNVLPEKIKKEIDSKGRIIYERNRK